MLRLSSAASTHQRLTIRGGFDLLSPQIPQAVFSPEFFLRTRQEFLSKSRAMSLETSFPKLLAQAKAGNTSALERVMFLYKPTVCNEIRSFQNSLSSDISSQDLEQEVWVRVWTRLPGFMGSPNEEACRLMFAAWLRLTTRRVGLSIIEKSRAQKRGGDDHPDPLDHPVAGAGESPSSIVRADESKEALHQAISLLDDQAAEIVRLHFFADLSMQMVAEKMGLTRDQVRYRIQLALETLGRRLEDPGD